MSNSVLIISTLNTKIMSDSNLIRYASLSEVKSAINSGVVVNWENGLYTVKIDFDGDLVLKPSNGLGGELLTDKHLSKLFTVNDFVNWNVAKTMTHDASGIDSPILWMWKQNDGGYFPFKPYGFYSLNDDGSNIKKFESILKDRDIFGLWERFVWDEINFGYSYEKLNRWLEIFEPLGLTFQFGLSAEPTDFKIVLF